MKKHRSGSAGYSAGDGIDNPGARLQMLESETQLSRGRLIKLYKELRGSPPPKGMLPFSTDWFMTREQNVHASMFCNAWQFY